MVVTPAKEYTGVVWMERKEFKIKFLGITLSRRVREAGWYKNDPYENEWKWKPIDREKYATDHYYFHWNEKEKKIMENARLCIYFRKDAESHYFKSTEEAIQAANSLNANSVFVEIQSENI